MNESQSVRNAAPTLALLDKEMKKHGIRYWLEAGTALAAARDGVIFPWEHDIDIAVWRDASDQVVKVADEFRRNGWRIIVQKNLPLLDNIIQMKWNGSENDRPFPDQIDIYLYTRQDGYAYMRWLNAPVGKLSWFFKQLILVARTLVTLRSKRFGRLLALIPEPLRLWLFGCLLKVHINHASCIFHRFPVSFFEELREIDFYGVKIPMPADQDRFLKYRYGENWRTPDSNFNQSGKWRSSLARVTLPMKTLPIPSIDLALFKKYKES